MGFFKVLGYVAAGVGAVVLIPATGGGSLAVALGALGTTTAAGAALGATAGAAVAAADLAISSDSKSYERGRTAGVEEGAKAAKAVAAQSANVKIAELTARLREYHDFDDKLLALYALGLAVARCDGQITDDEVAELDIFVAGCSAGNLPKHIKKAIADMVARPPTLSQAREAVEAAGVPAQDVEDLIMLVAEADGIMHPKEKAFLTRWRNMAGAGAGQIVA